MALPAENAATPWDAIIARHNRRVLLMLLARRIPLDRARDITQETWARLIEHERNGRLGRLEMPGLALKQATFLALDERRRKQGSDEEIAFLLDPAPSIEDRLVTRSQLERASIELERCAPKARRVFEAVYQHPDTPHAETAKLFGISVERLRHTICEVRARLRSALEDDSVHIAFARSQENPHD